MNTDLHTFIRNNCEYDEVTKTIIFDRQYNYKDAPEEVHKLVLPIWDVLEKTSTGIDGVFTALHDGQLINTFINKGHSLPCFSRKITTFPYEEIMDRQRKRTQQQEQLALYTQHITNKKITKTPPFPLW